MLLFLLFEQLFQQITIGPGICQFRILLQCLVISLDCLLQFAFPGQGIAQVIAGLGIFFTGPEFLCLLIVAGAVQRTRFPVRIPEGLGCLLRLFLLHQLLSLLIRPVPQVRPPVRLNLAGKGHDHDEGQQQDAAAKSQRRQGQDSQQQPGTVIPPAGDLLVSGITGVRQALFYVFHAQAAYITIIQRHGGEPPLACTSHFFQ